MGRPAKPAKDRQSRVVAVRLTPAEYKELVKVGKAIGKNDSEVLRRCIQIAVRGVEIYRIKRMKIL